MKTNKEMAEFLRSPELLEIITKYNNLLKLVEEDSENENLYHIRNECIYYNSNFICELSDKLGFIVDYNPNDYKSTVLLKTGESKYLDGILSKYTRMNDLSIEINVIKVEIDSKMYKALNRFIEYSVSPFVHSLVRFMEVSQEVNNFKMDTPNYFILVNGGGTWEYFEDLNHPLDCVQVRMLHKTHGALLRQLMKNNDVESVTKLLNHPEAVNSVDSQKSMKIAFDLLEN